MHLVGISEIAVILGVTNGRASQLAREKGFPDPLNEEPLKMGPVWERQTIERWTQINRPNEDST